jgi:hypothetical protein
MNQAQERELREKGMKKQITNDHNTKNTLIYFLRFESWRTYVPIKEST